MPEEKKLNIYQKLAKIRKQVEVIKKNRSGYGYKYVSDDEILAKITGSMDKLGVSLIPGIVPGTLDVAPYTYQKTKNGKQETVNEILVKADAVYTRVNNEEPTGSIVVPWALVGRQADASQSFGSGLTYTYRYFLLKYFNVSTVEDDPDNWRSKQRKAEEAENRANAVRFIVAARKLFESLCLLVSDASIECIPDIQSDRGGFAHFSAPLIPVFCAHSLKKEVQKNQYLQGFPGSQHEVLIRVIIQRGNVLGWKLLPNNKIVIIYISLYLDGNTS